MKIFRVENYKWMDVYFNKIIFVLVVRRDIIFKITNVNKIQNRLFKIVYLMFILKNINVNCAKITLFCRIINVYKL